MIKETIFTNSIEEQHTNTTQETNAKPSTHEIEVTPQEVLDYFTNNTTHSENSSNTDKESEKGKARVINDKGDVTLTISHEEWKDAGLAELEKNQEEKIADPITSTPIPEISDPLLNNDYTQELLHSSITNTTQSRMLYDLSKVTITDDEKEYYLRTVLENEPLELYITVGNKHKIGFNCKSKTIATQNLITKLADVYVTERDPNDKTQYKHSTFESGMYLLKLNAMFCLGGEGDEDGVKNPGLFKEIPLDLPFVEQQVIVEENNKIIDGLSFAKWNAIINILRIFEQKEALLGAELISGDF